MRERLIATLTAARVPWSRITGDDGPSCVVEYQPTATAEEIQAGNALLAAFDWSPATHAAWLVQQATVQAISGTMRTNSPAAISDRVMLRYVLTLLNDVRVHVGLPRIEEPQHLAALQAAAMAGYGSPVG